MVRSSTSQMSANLMRIRITKMQHGNTDSIYGLSRRINPLQRLFDGHVLRSFDVQLAETPPPIEMRRGRKRLPSNSPIDE